MPALPSTSQETAYKKFHQPRVCFSSELSFRSPRGSEIPSSMSRGEKFWAFNDIKLLQHKTKGGADQDESRWGKSSARQINNFSIFMQFLPRTCAPIRSYLCGSKFLIYCAKCWLLSEIFLLFFSLPIYCIALTERLGEAFELCCTNRNFSASYRAFFGAHVLTANDPAMSYERETEPLTCLPLLLHMSSPFRSNRWNLKLLLR